MTEPARNQREPIPYHDREHGGFVAPSGGRLAAHNSRVLICTPPPSGYDLLAMPGRPNKPLFELLRDSSREAPARPLPPLKIDAPMSSRTERPERFDPDESPSGRSSGRAQPRPRAFLPVSQNAIYIGIAVALVLVVVAYAVGVTVGKSSAAAEYRQRLTGQAQPVPVTDPLGDNRPSGARRGDINPPPAPGSGNKTTERATTPLQSATPDGRYLSARGNLPSDPREPGLNYLSLAILGPEDTQEAIAYLAANGVESVGIPLLGAVDRKKPAANNLPSYKLVALPGITGAEYSQRQPARTRLEEAVERLGTAWQKEYRGSSNFAKHAWEKYQP